MPAKYTIGQILYRCEWHPQRTTYEAITWEVVSLTPSGARIMRHKYPRKQRLLLNSAAHPFACETEDAALAQLKARTRRARAIAVHDLEMAKRRCEALGVEWTDDDEQDVLRPKDYDAGGYFL
jgi:hypothetical protein